MSTMRLGKSSLAEVVRLALEARIAEIRVGMPASIQSFDPSTQLASVKPQLQDSAISEDGSELTLDLPVISHVPVQFPGGGGHSITFPVKAGDPCWLSFSDRSLDKWLDAGAVADPVDLRTHHLTDAVAFLGVRARPQAIAGFDGAHTTLGQDGQPADFVALAGRVSQALTTLYNAISSAPVAPGDGGATFKAALVSALSGWPPNLGSATTKVKG
jgi:hypothetical protein